MEPHGNGRRVRTDDVTAWWYSLDALTAAPQRRLRTLPATLVLAAAVLAASMRQAWHHQHIPGDTFTVVDGLGADSWLLVVAAIALGLAIRTLVTGMSSGVRWTITVLAFATVNGMFFDYFDWSTRGVSLYTPAYYGPGFFVGLGGAALLVLAAIVAWRTPD